MSSVIRKSQELEVRSIMQGMEEFANFISFTGNHSDMRILSVETEQRTELPVKRQNRLGIVETRRPDHKPLV